MLNWIIYNYKKNKIKHELKLKQLECAHHLKYYGRYEHWFNCGSSVDFEYRYKARCVKCGFEINRDSKIELETIIDFQNNI